MSEAAPEPSKRLEADSDSTPSRQMVSTEGLRHFYRAPDGGLVHALEHVSINIGEGEFACIIGRSGCGKSTLLKIIGGLISPSEGSVHVHGMPVTKPSRQTGYMFQEATLLDWRTALDNVLLPIEIRQGKQAAQRERGYAETLLESAGILEFASSYPHQLSGGIAQRVAICRMLVTRPQLLLLDEPFGALDELTRESMNEDLKRVVIQAGATAVMVTHSIPEAVFMADRVLVMSSRPGRIARTIDIHLPMDRTYDITTEPAYGRLVGRVRDGLNETRSPE